VADTFDAMTSDRPYRMGMPAQIAFAEVVKQSGKQFDPECSAAFLAISEQVVAVMKGRNPGSAGDMEPEPFPLTRARRLCGSNREDDSLQTVVSGSA
jgi:hypothetical protein